MTRENIGAMDAAKVLNVIGLTKSYGGLTAVDDVSFEVFEGEILALVGDNGAGKSTLVKALAGAQPPDGGRIEVNGELRQLNSPRDASEAGIGCLHQGLGLVDTLNVPENVFLGRELLTRLLLVIPQLDHRQMRERTIELLAGFGISLPRLNDPVIRLSGGQRQTVAISRLLLQDVRLVVMDEPMAALGVEEGRRVLDLVRTMRDRGISVIIISHNLEHVFQLADRIAIMKNGRLIGVVNAAATTRDEVVRLITFGAATQSEAHIEI
ncbi:MAG: sugar ABC transporter ATP-binding protein [Boseongicola sp. SB0677_bin_26]|nr:sugar ABC transporter ATP-binding protein [Boseongicola sp. SB0665_bin_10]MYG28517.1 sugar ABC transporter ATP-binding protein [Boseongicola sp. SB0677_bin_26]